MGNQRLHKLGKNKERIHVMFLCSICLGDVDPDIEEYTTMIVNGRRAFYHKACLKEEHET